jgi:hypothetical protein
MATGQAVSLRRQRRQSMINNRPLKILHLLSQRSDSTGSGIYIQAMLHEA